MGAFEWNEKFSVHIDEMDNHHKKLLGYFSALENKIRAGNATQKVGEILDALAEYANFHFTEEVRLMRVINYPELETHLIQHAYFTNEVNEMIGQFSRGTLPSQSVLAFLRDWFINHIMSEDFKYGVLIQRGNLTASL